MFSLAALIIAARSDLRERIVSNRLNSSMLCVGLLGHAAWAVLAGSTGIFLNCLAATISMFLFALVLYKAGVWAGGDVKLFAGLAALNPLNPNILSRLGFIALPFFAAIELPIFPFTLFVFSIVAMLPYGVFLAMRRLARNRAQGEKILRQLRLFALGFAAAAIGAGVSFACGFAAAGNLLLIILMFWAVYFLLRLYAMSKVLMRKALRISDLQEGMIVAETIVETRSGAERKPEEGVKKLIKYFAANRFEKAIKQQREVVSSRKARGVTAEEIKELQGLVRAGKLEDAITVKESAPMVPAVLAAYIALNIIGDFAWLTLF